jgi:predicted amidohydrolase YtcJ
MLWASGRIGRARLATGYRIASFRKAGVEVAVGTDWPVEPLDPRRNLYAALARAFPDGTGGWTPEEKIGVEEALDLYTRGSAAAEGQDSVKGTLQPGRLADLAVFTEDLIEAGQKNSRSLLEAKVVMTISGGRVVFASKP